MAHTLGQRYDSICIKIENTETAQSYNDSSSGKELSRGDLRTLYAERDRLLAKIERYGRNYIEGQNTTPVGDTSLVSFV